MTAKPIFAPWEDADWSGLPTSDPGSGRPWLNPSGSIGVGDFTLDLDVIADILGYTPADDDAVLHNTGSESKSGNLTIGGIMTATELWSASAGGANAWIYNTTSGSYVKINSEGYIQSSQNTLSFVNALSNYQKIIAGEVQARFGITFNSNDDKIIPSNLLGYFLVGTNTPLRLTANNGVHIYDYYTGGYGALSAGAGTFSGALRSTKSATELGYHSIFTGAIGAGEIGLYVLPTSTGNGANAFYTNFGTVTGSAYGTNINGSASNGIYNQLRNTGGFAANIIWGSTGNDSFTYYLSGSSELSVGLDASAGAFVVSQAGNLDTPRFSVHATTGNVTSTGLVTTPTGFDMVGSTVGINNWWRLYAVDETSASSRVILESQNSVKRLTFAKDGNLTSDGNVWAKGRLFAGPDTGGVQLFDDGASHVEPWGATNTLYMTNWNTVQIGQAVFRSTSSMFQGAVASGEAGTSNGSIEVRSTLVNPYVKMYGSGSDAFIKVNSAAIGNYRGLRFGFGTSSEDWLFGYFGSLAAGDLGLYGPFGAHTFAANGNVSFGGTTFSQGFIAQASGHGKCTMQKGDGSHTGYVEWIDQSGTRNWYAGYNGNTSLDFVPSDASYALNIRGDYLAVGGSALDTRWYRYGAGEASLQAYYLAGTTWQTPLSFAASSSGAKIVFLGAAPTTRQTLSAAATDATTTQSLLNQIRLLLIEFGLAA